MIARLTARRLARRLDGVRLIAFWEALGDDVRAEKAATDRILAAVKAETQTARSTT